jgi:hypothetical protein
MAGTLRVVRLSPRGSTQAVFNIEVEVDHTYSVGPNGILTHNPQFCPRALGSYWSSGKKVFPTSRTAKVPRRVRGSGRGGKTVWEASEEGVRNLQREWVHARRNELLNRGFSAQDARKIMEGQILEQGLNPYTGFLKSLLDSVFG